MAASLKFSGDELLHKRDELLREFESLESDHRNGRVSDQHYRAERNRIERELVAIMDRLTQARFFAGNP